jgi:hypothetical protein
VSEDPAEPGDQTEPAEAADLPPLEAYGSDPPPGAPFASPGASDGSRFVLELLLERTTREERDVGRLVRLDELIGRHPGSDRVVLRILGINGRDSTALELAERVDCCPDLVDGMIRELGEEAVRVRSVTGDPGDPDGSARLDPPSREPVAAGAWPAAPPGSPGGPPAPPVLPLPAELASSSAEVGIAFAES